MAARFSFGEPASTGAVQADGSLSTALQTWISRMTSIGQAAQQSGTTADRPDDRLWIGRQYWDTTLGLPVYVRSVNPTVWVNAAGGVV